MENIDNTKTSEKQNMLLYLIYATHRLPLEALVNFPRTFTESNITYKLIPKLIKAGYIKRERIGYNKEYGENDEQKGKGCYDTVRLTRSGIHYVEQVLGTTKILANVRETSIETSDSDKCSIIQQERAKKQVLTDLMFAPSLFFNPLNEVMQVHRKYRAGTQDILFQDLLVSQTTEADIETTSAPFRYYRTLELKRVEFDFSKLQTNQFLLTKDRCNTIASSKAVGVLNLGTQYLPVYNAGHYNVSVSPRDENKFLDYLNRNNTLCNSCIYVSQSSSRMLRMLKREMQEFVLKNNQYSLFDIDQYKKIYLLPYGNQTLFYKYLLYQIRNGEVNARIKAGEGPTYFKNIFSELYQKQAKITTYDAFDSRTEEYNYYIGFVPELRQMKQIVEWYYNNPNDQPLCIICAEEQKTLYEEIFCELKAKDKLYFGTMPLEQVLGEGGGLNE